MPFAEKYMQRAERLQEIADWFFRIQNLKPIQIILQEPGFLRKRPDGYRGPSYGFFYYPLRTGIMKLFLGSNSCPNCGGTRTHIHKVLMNEREYSDYLRRKGMQIIREFGKSDPELGLLEELFHYWQYSTYPSGVFRGRSYQLAPGTIDPEKYGNDWVEIEAKSFARSALKHFIEGLS